MGPINYKSLEVKNLSQLWPKESMTVRGRSEGSLLQALKMEEGEEPRNAGGL